jgi:hypothetical protein
MPLTPTLLLVPSVSAGQILLRRLAREKRAVAAISATRPKDLAEKMAEGKCHALGLQAWRNGHGALLSAKLLASHPELLRPGLPEAPVARVLARTLEDLRAAAIRPSANGKKASLQTTLPLSGRPASLAFQMAIRLASTRLICPAPIPRVDMGPA